MPKKFQRSPLTERLLKYLSAFDKGTLIEYTELSKITGEKISSRTANLNYAKKLLEAEYRQVWIAVRNVGVKRCTDIEIAERLPNFHLRGARGKLKRGGKQTHVVDLQQLNTNEQTKFGVHAMQQQLALDALSRAKYNQIAKSVRGTSNDLPAFNILEWALPLSMPKKKS